MNTRPRLLLGRFAMASPRMSKKTKPPSHYDTLEVNQRATQGEIKAAYFKLSKEYHPDKNRSEAATSKFRDIAEAYEVLGNFNSRKAYDRSMLTRTKYGALHPRSSKDDPKVQHHRAETAIFRDSGKSGSAPMYDFDAWTKAHYGRTLDRTLRDRAQGARRRASRLEGKEALSGSPGWSIVGVILSVGIFILLANWKVIDYDDPSLVVRNERYDKKESPESESARVDVSTESLLTK